MRRALTADWHAERGAIDDALTEQALMRLDYIAPPADLQPYVTTYFLFRCDEIDIRDMQPAAVGQFQIYLRGHGVMYYPHGRSDPSFPVTVQGPTTVAAPFEVNGPFHAFGAALSGLGWAALTGLAADKSADRLHDAAGVFGQDATAVGDAVRAAYEADPEMDGQALADIVSAFLRPRIRRVPQGHVQLLRQVAGWLGAGFNPPTQELYDASEYSPRQVQRLVARYLGSGPTHLMRIYRATRVVALLSQTDVSENRVAELTEVFYDQSHMIREIREFTGRTPARLLAEDGSILRTLLDVRNFREIHPQVAPLPPLESDADDA